ncbi:MAG: cytochrome P450 [Opitutaceae bacterium]|nr:cytochrome P450 [Opitutaceae bacterium]
MHDPTADWLTPEFFQNPYPHYATLRAQGLVHWSPKLNMWLVPGYALTHEGLKDHTRFSNVGRIGVELATLPEADRAAIAPLADELGTGLIHSDPPDHTRMRRIVSQAFTPRVIETQRRRTTGLVDELIDNLRARGRCDFIAEFAFPLPILVISDLFGVPRADRDRIKAWSECITDLGSRRKPLAELARDALQATREMKVYFEAILDERRREPRDDLITLLLNAEDAGERLSRSELIGMAILILVAGHETTTSLLSNGLLLLLQNPDQLTALRADPALMPTAIEEMLRVEPSFLRTPRRVKADLEWGGVQLQRDQMVSVLNGAANRDPAVFTDPDRFDIRRSPNKHLSFGHGPHICLGAPLARLEASLAFPRLLERLPQLELAGDVLWKEDFSTRRLERLDLQVG